MCGVLSNSGTAQDALKTLGMSLSIPQTRPGAGRPTRAQAEQRHQELLDQALEMFLEKGYELATIEAIAAAVGMTKRTVYARYEDKRALFRAVVQRAIDRFTVPNEVLDAIDRSNLENALLSVCRIRMANAVSPAGLRLQRIINVESYRFPEILRLAYDQGSRPTIEFLTSLLRQHTEAGTVIVEKPEIAAPAFLSMVVGAPLRSISFGGPIDEEALEERIPYFVKLFLNGIRPRA
jgi:AcrR family transcriptional regulator